MRTREPDSKERPTAADPQWKRALYTIIFESDTPAGKAFDVSLLIAIGMSVAIVMLESVKSVHAAYGPTLRVAEWVFTALFTIEYVARLLCVRRPRHYAWSFYGVVDLLAILPSFIGLFTSANYVMVVRILRLLRVFRVLKLAHFLQETDTLVLALRASQRKVLVFLFAVLTLVTIVGTMMYLIEGEE
nr:ion transporter [Chthoniobacterales bacterium]